MTSFMGSWSFLDFFIKKQPVLEQVTPGNVPVFIMLQLDWMSDDGSSLRHAETLEAHFKLLKLAGVRGVMADIWWGICEPEPNQYRFGAVKALCAMLKDLGLELQATMSFHQCGGNVGDPVVIPIPAWAMQEAQKKDLLYRHGKSQVSDDCLSWSAANQRVFPGESQLRTALECYHDYMAAFLKECQEYIGDTIPEMQVGMGPCGELRYPSYMMSKGWQYPGVGLVMADDEGMRKSLHDSAGLKDLPSGLPEEQNALPDDSAIFRAGDPCSEGFRTGDGKKFFEWYTASLIKYGESMLLEAAEALKKLPGPAPAAEKFSFSAKVSGLHWHCMHPSRATEACAGYSHGHGAGNAYDDIAAMLAKVAKTNGRPALFNFTCLEMTNIDNKGNPQADSAPEDLIAQVRFACIKHAVPMCGENALEFDLATGDWAFERMSKQLRGWSKGRDRMHGLTLLRLNDHFVEAECLQQLGKFVAST